MDTILSDLATARGDSVARVLGGMQSKLREQRKPLSRTQLEMVLRAVNSKFTPNAEGADRVSAACLDTYAAIAGSAGADVPEVWAKSLPEVVAALRRERIRDQATSLLRRLVVTFTRFGVVGEALITNGLSSAFPELRAAAAHAIPTVFVPALADSIDFRRLLDALSSKLHDSLAVIEGSLRALGFLRATDPANFERQVKKLRYVHQQHINDHADAIQSLAKGFEGMKKTDSKSKMKQKSSAAPESSSRSLRISGVHINGSAASFGGADMSINGSNSSVGSSSGGRMRSGRAASGSGAPPSSSSSAAPTSARGEGPALEVHGTKRGRTSSIGSSGVTPRRGSLQFGFVPEVVLANLQSATFETRLTAADDLCVLVQSADSAQLRSHLASFIRLPGLLVAERQYRLVMAGLTIVDILCERCGSRVGQHMDHIVPALTHQLGATKVVLRKAALRTFSRLMLAVGSTALLPALLRATEHPRNQYVREAGCKLIILALLTSNALRRFDYDPPSLARSLAPLLHDKSDRVRLCVTELLAVVAHLGRGSVDVLELLRPVGLDPSSHAAVKLAKRLGDSSLQLPSVSEDGLPVLPNHASVPDVADHAGSFRNLDQAAREGGMSSRGGSRRSGIPFDMPKRVGSALSRRGSRHNVSEAAGTVENRVALKLHIDENEHKSMAQYKAAIGLADSSSEDDEHAGFRSSRAGVSPVRLPKGRGLSNVQKPAEVDSPTGKSWLHDGAGAADQQQQQSRQPHQRGQSYGSQRSVHSQHSRQHSMQSERSEYSVGSHRSVPSYRRPSDGSSVITADMASVVSYVPTRKDGSQRRQLASESSSSRSFDSQRSMDGRGGDDRRGYPGQGQGQGQGYGAESGSRRGMYGRQHSSEEVHGDRVAEARRASYAKQFSADDAYSQQPRQPQQQQPPQARQAYGDGAAQRGPLPSRRMVRPRAHTDMTVQAARPHMDVGDVRQSPLVLSTGDAGPVRQPLVSPMLSNVSRQSAGFPASDDYANVEYTDTYDSSDDDEVEVSGGAERGDKEVQGVTSSSSRNSNNGSANSGGHGRTLPRTFSQVITKQEMEQGQQAGGLKVAFRSTGDASGAASGGTEKPLKTESSMLRLQVANSIHAVDSSDDDELPGTSVATHVQPHEPRSPGQRASVATTEGDSSPKKHLMTLLSRRRNASRNSVRRVRGGRAASASSRVEGQSNAPVFGRYKGYGYGEVDADERLAHRPGVRSALGRTSSDKAGGEGGGEGEGSQGQGAGSGRGRSFGSSRRRGVVSKKGSMTPDPSAHRKRFWHSTNVDDDDDSSSEEEDEEEATVPEPVVTETPRDLRGDDRPLKPMSQSQMEALWSSEAPLDVSKSDPNPLPNNAVQPKVMGRPTRVSKATEAMRRRREARVKASSDSSASPTRGTVGGSPSPTKSVSRSPARVPRRGRAASARRDLPPPSPARTKSALGFGSTNSVTGGEYIESADLKDLPNPEKSARTVARGLSSGEWQVQFSATNVLRALAVRHPQLLSGPVLKDCVHALANLAKSLRSSVAKNALMAYQDLFDNVARGMERHMDAVAPLLVKKSSDTLRILSSAGSQGLVSMVNNCSDRLVLSALINCTARGMNNDVRNKCGRHLARAVSKMSAAKIQSLPNLDSLIAATARQMNEGSEEPRRAAKQIILHLSSLGILTPTLLGRCLSRADADRVNSMLARGIKPDHSFLSEDYDGRSGSVSRAASRNASSRLGSHRRPFSGRSHAATPSTSRSPSAELEASPPPKPMRAGSRRSPAVVRRRMGSGPPVAVNSADADKFVKVIDQMNSSDWRQREDSLKDIVEFTDHCTAFAQSKAHVIADNLYKRLSDGNSKVQGAALQASQQLVPKLGAHLERSIPQLVPPLAALITGTSRLSSAADKTMELIVTTLPPHSTAPVLSSQALHGNSRTRAVMLSKLAAVAPALYDSHPALMSRHVLPALFRSLQDAKHDVKVSAKELAKCVGRLLGADVVLAAAKKRKVSEHDTKRLRSALGVM